MAERPCLELRPGCVQLGVDVGRVLPGEAGQRAQGLQLSHGRQPGVDGAAVPRTPRLDRQRAVDLPHREQGHGCEELVAPGVEQIHEDAQPADYLRGAPAPGHELLVEPGEQWARHRFALEPVQHRRQHLEVGAVPRHRALGLQHAPPRAPAGQHLHSDGRDHDGQRKPADCPQRDGGQHRGGQQEHADPEPGVRRGDGGEARERGGPDAGGSVLTQHREILAQIQPRRQLLHRCLPPEHHGHVGRRQQPGGQRLLPHDGAGAAQQLEERARAEEIQVGGVGMVRIEEARAGAPAAGCPAIKARQSALVERLSTLCPPSAPSHAAVHHHEYRERGRRRQQPPGR